MTASRFAKWGRRVAMLCVALIVVLCAQFVVVAVESVEHRLGVDHGPLSVAGTVIVQAPPALQHDHEADHDDHADISHDHQSGEGSEAPDHRHMADATPGNILPVAAATQLPMPEPARVHAALLRVLSGLTIRALERPPNFLK